MRKVVYGARTSSRRRRDEESVRSASPVFAAMSRATRSRRERKSSRLRVLLNVVDEADMSRKETRVLRLMLPRRPVLSLLLVLIAPPLSGQRVELERRIQRQILPNGLEVIAVENRGVPLVTIEVDVRNGSFTQGPQFEGLSHLYEHMFFKANTEYPEPDQFVSRASELGAV